MSDPRNMSGLLETPTISADLYDDPSVVEASSSLIDTILGPPPKRPLGLYTTGRDLVKRGVNPRLAWWAVENLDLNFTGDEEHDGQVLDFLAERLVSLNDSKAGQYPELVFPTVRKGESKIPLVDLPSEEYLAEGYPSNTLGLVNAPPWEDGMTVILHNRPPSLVDEWMQTDMTKDNFPHEMHHVGQYLQAKRRGDEEPSRFPPASLAYSQFTPTGHGYSRDADPREIEATIAAKNALAPLGTPVWELPVAGTVFEEDFPESRRTWGREAMGYTPGMSAYEPTWRDRVRNLTNGLLDW